MGETIYQLVEAPCLPSTVLSICCFVLITEVTIAVAEMERVGYNPRHPKVRILVFFV